MPHPPTRACEADHCHSHDEDEPQTGVGVGTLCGECGHWFPDDQALIVAERELRDSLELPAVPLDAATIYPCPYCSHDF